MLADFKNNKSVMVATVVLALLVLISTYQYVSSRESGHYNMENLVIDKIPNQGQNEVNTNDTYTDNEYRKVLQMPNQEYVTLYQYISTSTLPTTDAWRSNKNAVEAVDPCVDKYNPTVVKDGIYYDDQGRKVQNVFDRENVTITNLKSIPDNCNAQSMFAVTGRDTMYFYESQGPAFTTPVLMETVVDGEVRNVGSFYYSDGKTIFIGNKNGDTPNNGSKPRKDVKTLDDTDIATFSGLRVCEYFAKDKNNVYVVVDSNRYSFDKTLKKVKDADSSSFICIGRIGDSEYAKDKNHVYKFVRTVVDYEARSSVSIIDQYNPESFRLLSYKNKYILNHKTNFSKNEYSGYTIDSHGMYYLDVFIPNADVESFVALNSMVGKDKNHIYIEGVIDHRFSVNDFNFINYWYTNGEHDVLATTSQYVYVYNKRDGSFENQGLPEVKVLKDADPKTFKEFSPTKYSSIYIDNNHLWNRDFNLHDIIMLKDIDVGSFVYSKDTGLYKDKNHVYAGLEIIKGFNPSSLEPVLYTDGKSRSMVYVRDDRYVSTIYGEIIVGADPKTFRVDAKNDEFEIDKNYVYFGTNTLALDPNKYKIDLYQLSYCCHDHYVYDDKNMYYIPGHPYYRRDDAPIRVEGVDIKTFHRRDYDEVSVEMPEKNQYLYDRSWDAKDKNHYYLMGKVVK